MRSRRRGGFHIGGQHAGHITNVGRDQINVHDMSGWFAVQQTHGIGRFLAVVGMLVAMAGVGFFGYAVVSFMIEIFAMMSQEFGPGEMPTMDVAAIMLPWLPLGIGLAFVGGVVTNIGTVVGRRRID
jgi:hypothetical protein